MRINERLVAAQLVIVGMLLGACAVAGGAETPDGDALVPGDGGGDPGGGGPDGGGSPSGGGGAPDAPPSLDLADAGPVTACTKMDLVFVIDDSTSMGQEQANLTSNFPQFVALLDDYGGDTTPLDYRIAVTTTGRDMTLNTPFGAQSFGGANGAFLQGEGCGMSQRWLARGEPDVAGKFSCVASVGTSGPPVEMPLLALELALFDRMDDGTNEGFLREDALLAVIFLTDEDDCSRRDPVLDATALGLCAAPHVPPVGHFIGLLDQAKGDRARWAATVIAGPGPGPCESAFGTADEATRLRQFVDGVGPGGIFSSICAGDLSVGLRDALDTFDLACRQFPPVL
jgi:hypothetical protein